MLFSRIGPTFKKKELSLYAMTLLSVIRLLSPLISVMGWLLTWSYDQNQKHYNGIRLLLHYNVFNFRSVLCYPMPS